ncbi:phytoene desaturase family protein, partial [Isoptericola sp. NPDC060185]|uniref:phytoene desaturase family protein n=1 Tax=Isoptericola sp. NPDC060185 TaxID=3347065 RepID=UPI003662FAEA
MTTVVVGSGHNALVAACYLARAGHRVQVLERDEVPGGAVSTVARFPGHLVDRGSSAHIMIRHTGIIEELELERFGLRYLDCDPWGFTPSDGARPPIVFHRDLDETCASIAAACGVKDADAYRRFVEVWGERSARVMRSFGGPPTPGRLVRSFWGLDARAGGSALSREFLQSGDALLDFWFDDERLKASLAWFGAQSGPPMSEPGTAPMAGFAALMHTVPPGRAVGGSGALSAALIARLRADGGELHTGDAVTSLRRSGSGWQVATESGRTLHAGTVIAGSHILSTLDLLRAGDFDAQVLDDWQR